MAKKSKLSWRRLLRDARVGSCQGACVQLVRLLASTKFPIPLSRSLSR